jgi:carbamoyl-phosphate synthase large subunit
MTHYRNILILSAGRRVDLINAFLVELKQVFSDALVLTTDMNLALSAACQVADKAIKVPSIQAENYIDEIFNLCIEEKVGLVIPTIDTELLLLAQHQQRFSQAGINLIISDQTLVGFCRDKRETAKIFDSLDIPTPTIYSKTAIQFPCFAKPYDGSSSVGAMVVKDWSSLAKTTLENDKMMFMQLIDLSHDEYTVDAYYDKQGYLKCLVPRQRLQVRGGEISKGVTRRHQVYEYLLPKLNQLNGARGCITLQLFANLEEMSFFGIEVNPRFGGGYPLSYQAGANYPAWLVREYLQDQTIPFFDQWEANLLMLRYDAQVLCHGYP